MKKVALIPVFSSEKLMNKNVLMLEGKLVAGYSIEAALATKCFERIIVITDKQQYQDALNTYPIDVFQVEKPICSVQALLTIWQQLDPKAKQNDYAVILMPETPLRTTKQIVQFCQLFEQQETDYLYSIDPKKQENHSIYLYRLPFNTLNKLVNIQTYMMDKEGSLFIEDSFEYEWIKAILQLRVKNQTSLLNVQRRIREKSKDFNRISDITLVGHSLWDYWQIEQLNNIEVNNLGIGGITTQQYVELILKPQLIKGLGKDTLIFLGINEMFRVGWRAEDTLYWLDQTVQYLRKINAESRLYLMEVSYVAFKREVNSEMIDDFNQQLRDYFSDKNITLVDVNSVLQDQYHQLDLAFTSDGLHFNQMGYEKLADLLKVVLFN
ncbi:GDSL-type esterase/lipase family protein [Gallibacterium anatis]|uniref:GDSL-type esterase/lipase family protein n=1 Tax=Gallibacterium anatis TaxID=750 RepID=UPI003005F698